MDWTKMNHYRLLPNRLTKEEIAGANQNWTMILSTYRSRRRKAMRESTPGYNTLCAMVMLAVAKCDRKFVDAGLEVVKDVPRYVALSLAGNAFCDLGARDEGLGMLRQAAELHPSHTLLLAVAAETDDLAEKEGLAQQVLNDNPNDSDALRHLAYAKYFGGERQEAERLIDQILCSDANNLYARECKGNMCFDKEEYAEALSHYKKMSVKPLPISLQFKICHCYYLLGMTSKAKRIARHIHNRISGTCGLDISVESANQLLAEVLNA